MRRPRITEPEAVLHEMVFSITFMDAVDDCFPAFGYSGSARFCGFCARDPTKDDNSVDDAYA